ncbi:GT2 family glycosyltransferase [Algoriphagus sp. 4150]|uniref:glycosyltransferase family 2 protein n=1 Tax=Algoriphagus sp. 4150 TaxID=2817756 RepID=UPI00285A569C|nr:glycosyltransferase family 2 protein [Algoriphagus sp. 4150]MDR7130089.1 GT2 family glycosyltransferase [Algoriphagus sp. 4150]
MTIKKSISIIIPNYNGVSLLEKYLPDTLRAIRFADVPYEIIVVDDCSRDTSVDFVRANYPEVKLLVNDSNQGFSYTCNQGIQFAKMDLVMLLNTDVCLTEEYFSKLWRYFEDPNTFGVMSRIMNKDMKIEDAARFLAFSGMKFKATHFFYSNDPAKKTPTAYLSGANALIAREKLLELEGFDEVFSPFYCEDVDLSFRAWRLGWKCYYEHEAICYHEVSTTTRKVKSKRALQAAVYKNKFILHAIHLDGISLALWYGQMIFVEVLLRVLIGKFWILKSLREFYKSKDQIRISKEKLRLQMAAENSNYSLHDVKRVYFDSIRDWDISSVRLK